MFFHLLYNRNKNMTEQTKNLKLIGEGSSRFVYRLDDESVIKIAKNEAGQEQNGLELLILKEKFINSPFPKYKYNNENKELAVEYINAFHYNNDDSYEIFEKVFGMKFLDFINLLEFVSTGDTYLLETKYSKLKKESKEFIINLSTIIIKYNLSINEFYCIDQFGFKNEKIYCIDFGLSEQLKDKYYENDNY